MFVQVQVGVGARPFRDFLAGVGDQLRALRRFGVRHHRYERPEGKTYRGVRQQFVKVEGSRGDQVAIISGVKAGDEVVTSGVFKLRNGAAVQVNNKVQPGNNPAPKPEDS